MNPAMQRMQAQMQAQMQARMHTIGGMNEQSIAGLTPEQQGTMQAQWQERQMARMAQRQAPVPSMPQLQAQPQTQPQTLLQTQPQYNHYAQAQTVSNQTTETLTTKGSNGEQQTTRTVVSTTEYQNRGGFQQHQDGYYQHQQQSGFHQQAFQQPESCQRDQQQGVHHHHHQQEMKSNVDASHSYQHNMTHPQHPHASFQQAPQMFNTGAQAAHQQPQLKEMNDIEAGNVGSSTGRLFREPSKQIQHLKSSLEGFSLSLEGAFKVMGGVNGPGDSCCTNQVAAARHIFNYHLRPGITKEQFKTRIKSIMLSANWSQV